MKCNYVVNEFILREIEFNLFVFQFICAMLSGRFLEDVYILIPLVFTIYNKWMQVCGSARAAMCGGVRQVCRSTGGVRQYAAVYSSMRR